MSVWVEIPPELIARMRDIVIAVSEGHDSLFLLAEAVHIRQDLDELTVPWEHLIEKGEF